MMDTVQPDQQNKTNDLEQQGKEKTYRQKIMLDTVQLELQIKTNDPKQKEKRKRENIQAEVNSGHSAARVAEHNK